MEETANIANKGCVYPYSFFDNSLILRVCVLIDVQF